MKKSTNKDYWPIVAVLADENNEISLIDGKSLDKFLTKSFTFRGRPWSIIKSLIR